MNATKIEDGAGSPVASNNGEQGEENELRELGEGVELDNELEENEAMESGSGDQDVEEDTGDESSDEDHDASDDGASEEGDDAEAEAHDEALEEQQAIPNKPEDIPELFKAIAHPEVELDEDSFKAFSKLTDIIREDHPFAEKHLVPRIPELFDLLSRSTSDGTQAQVIEIICDTFFVSETSRAAIEPKFDTIVGLLGSSGDASVRQTICAFFERVLEEYPDLEASIRTLLKIRIYDPTASRTDEGWVNAVEAFENEIVFIREISRRAFVAAGALDFTCLAFHHDSKAVRTAAQSCLEQVLGYTDEIDAAIGSAETHDNPGTRERIVELFVQALHKGTDGIAAAGLLSALGEDTQAVLLKDQRTLVAYLALLAQKDPRFIDTGFEYTLAQGCEGEGLKVIAAGFRAVWEDNTFTTSKKLAIINGLVNSFVDLRHAALQGGLIAFVLKVVSEEESQRTNALAILLKISKDEQLVAYYIFETSAHTQLIALLSSPIAVIRHTAASILITVPDARDPDPESKEPLRPRILSSFLSQPVRSQLLELLHHEDRKTAGLVAHFLGDLLTSEEGTENWGYEDDSGLPPPPSPYKEAILEEAGLIHHLLTLLKDPESAPGALRLICQFCWGHANGFSIVKEGFVPFVTGPQAGDAQFFAALYGEYEGRFSGRQRRRVAEAAVQAGALPRAFALVEEIQVGTTPVEEIRKTVEGLRVLLCADSVDVVVGRQSRKLGVLVAALIADETKDSLQHAQWMLRLLNREGETLPGEWKELGTADTATHLANLLDAYPYDLDPEGKERPEEGPDPEEYNKRLETYEERVSAAQKEAEALTKQVIETVNSILSLIAPHSASLVRPLVLRAEAMSQLQDDSLRLVEHLLAESKSTLALAPTLQKVFKGQSAGSFSAFEEWIPIGPHLATAFYEADFVIWATAEIIERREEELDEDNYFARASFPISALGALAHTIPVSSSSRSVSTSFLSNPAALKVALDIINSSSTYLVSEAARSARALARLAKFYPEPIDTVIEPSILGTLLKHFNDPEAQGEDFAPLIGILSVHNSASVVATIRSLFAGLVPPPALPAEDQSTIQTGGGGKKNKKKKKAQPYVFQPRIGEREVWARIEALASTTPEARKAIVDAGVLDEAKGTVLKEPNDSFDHLLKTLQLLVSEDDGIYANAVSEILPRLGELLLKAGEGREYTTILKLVQAFLPEKMGLLAEKGMVGILTRALGEFPMSFDDSDELVEVVRLLIRSEVAGPVVVETLTVSLKSEGAVYFETWWGYSFALKSLLCLDDEAANAAALKAGAVEYAIRLLSSDNVDTIIKGGRLAGVLGVHNAGKALPALLSLDALALAVAGQNKMETLGNISFEEGRAAADDPDDYNDSVWKMNTDYHRGISKRMLDVVAVLKEEVPTFNDADS